MAPQSSTTTVKPCRGLWEAAGSTFTSLLMRSNRRRPLTTRPNTTCLPSQADARRRHTKNWLPLPLGPALAMDRQPRSLARAKLSSLNLPQASATPVPAEQDGVCNDTTNRQSPHVPMLATTRGWT